MDSKKKFKLKGEVVETLPGTKFKIKVVTGKDEDGEPQFSTLMGHLSGKMRMYYIRLNVGDIVDVEVSPYDLSKCIITFRHNKNKSN